MRRVQGWGANGAAAGSCHLPVDWLPIAQDLMYLFFELLLLVPNLIPASHDASMTLHEELLHLKQCFIG
jgi:hypothetical protein